MEQLGKVLVVENDAGIRQSLFETLGALGFMVGEAENGEEALVRLRMVDYDAVLLDINMPGNRRYGSLPQNFSCLSSPSGDYAHCAGR